MGRLYAWVKLVNTGSVTEGRALDAARIAVVRDRLGALLAEQPGAFETYDTGIQTATPAMWWDDSRKVIGSPEFAAWLARFWPDQPLSGTLGAYYEISITARGIAQRPSERPRWEGVSPESKARLKNIAKVTKRDEASLRRLSKNFDDRKHREAIQFVQVAAAKLRAAAALLSESAQERLGTAREIYAADVIDEQAILRASREASLLAEQTRKFGESLVEKSFGGLDVPQSAGQWQAWETSVGEHLLELGVPKARVVALFKRPTADPEHERTRIEKNLRRKAEGTSQRGPVKKPAAKGAPTKGRGLK
jgi:hypothetical protein